MFSSLFKLSSSFSFFQSVKLAPADPIFGVDIAFKKDPNPLKINLRVGAYRDENNKPYVFKCVEKAQDLIYSSRLNKEYLPIDGHPEFNVLSQKLILGQIKPNVVTIQTLSGTGALSLGFHFLKAHLNPKQILISCPTWANHKNIIQETGIPMDEYPYFLPQSKGFDLKGMLTRLQTAEENTVVLLQACAHNPTGVDPKLEEWKSIASVMKKRKLIPFFDNAYQGYGTGDIARDRQAIEYFVKDGFQMLIAQSFSKNMGLYAERIGALHVLTHANQESILSQMKVLIRKFYSNPPLHGALIVQNILKNHHQEWEYELKNTVAARIIKMRTLLRDRLQAIETPGSWCHITDQIGMFSYTGLTQGQCQTLVNSGRISVAGITPANIQYLAQSIKSSIIQ